MSQQERFQLSGNSAELYQRFVVPYNVSHWAQELVRTANLKPGERVLDVACGTGAVARLAAEMVRTDGHVTGLDLNAGMLAVARSLPPPSGATITWLEADVGDMDLEDDSFDVVLSQQGFQYFPDKLVALGEMYRVLVPGGRLVLSLWKRSNVYTTALADAMERYMSSEVANRQRASRVTPQAEEIHDLMTQARFQEVVVRPQVLTTRMPLPEEYVPQHLTGGPAAGNFAALDDVTRAALLRHVHQQLQAYIEGDRLVYADEIHLATARK